MTRTLEDVLSETFTTEALMPFARRGHPDAMTDTDLRENLSHGARELALACLDALREAGLLSPAPHGASDRQAPSAMEWNAFVERGRAGISDYGSYDFLACPLPSALRYRVDAALTDAIDAMRTSRGYAPLHDMRSRGGTGPMVIDEADLRTLSEAAAAGPSEILRGRTWSPLFEFDCRKTGDRLRWRQGDFLAPALEVMVGDEYVPLGPYLEPAPARHIEMPIPSGRMILTSWVRVPGFPEGAGADDPEEICASVSDRGVDESSRRLFETSGILNVWVNGMTHLIPDGDLLRVGRFDEDHPDYWNDEGEPSDVPMPKVSPRLNDFRELMILDRDAALDVIMRGASRAAGGPATRDEAEGMLDAFVERETIGYVTVEPGTALHVYAPTGHNASRFGDAFASPDVPVRAGVRDVMVLSLAPLRTDPEKVEESGWQIAIRDADAPRPG